MLTQGNLKQVVFTRILDDDHLGNCSKAELCVLFPLIFSTFFITT